MDNGEIKTDLNESKTATFLLSTIRGFIEVRIGLPPKYVDGPNR